MIKKNLHVLREYIKEKAKFDFIQNVIRPIFAGIRKEFSGRYNMLDISLRQYAPEFLCAEKIDYIKNTVEMSLIVNEKYTRTKIAIPIILECKQ